MPTASKIAIFLNATLHGDDLEVNGACTLTNPQMGRVLFARNLTQDQITLIRQKTPLLVLHNTEMSSHPFANIQVGNPRLAFAQVLAEFFVQEKIEGIASSSIIGKAKIGNGVRIGHNAVIGDDVVIGDNTVIEHNVVIYPNVVIGENCRIKSNTTIGAKGFGFERNESGIPIELPHLGGVLIGNGVEVGANNTIVSGMVEPTIVEDDVKIDDHVHIAHNTVIGARTLITACAEISGSVRVGKDCWIGPNSSIINGVEIMDNAFVGIGAVVTKTVAAGARVAGNPAKVLQTI